MKESELQDAIGSLPRGIKPQRDLWPDISQRLGAVEKADKVHYQVPFWRKPAMAAAVLLALTGGIFIGRGMDTEPAGETARSMLEYALIGTVEATEREYQAAFRELVPLDSPVCVWMAKNRMPCGTVGKTLCRPRPLYWPHCNNTRQTFI